MQENSFNFKNKQGVFFDCWDTVIKFKSECENFRIEPLKKHCINSNEVNFEELNDFSEKFMKDFYFSGSNYEIPIESIYNLFCINFNIKLDCSVKVCCDEVLDYLSPSKVDNIDLFLKYLENRNIPYAILSNTIYSSINTKKIVEKYIPDNHFLFVLGSADISVKKPNSLFFTSGVKYANLSIKDSIYIGDTYKADVYGSYKAGFKKSIWLNWKNSKIPTDVIEDVTSKDSVIEIKSYDELIKKCDEGKIL